LGKEIECDLNNLLQHLEIREDEEQRIVPEEDLEELKAEARWTTLPKVSSSKTLRSCCIYREHEVCLELGKRF